jgi:hypothetical protein
VFCLAALLVFLSSLVEAEAEVAVPAGLEVSFIYFLLFHSLNSRGWKLKMNKSSLAGCQACTGTMLPLQLQRHFVNNLRLSRSISVSFTCSLQSGFTACFLHKYV